MASDAETLPQSYPNGPSKSEVVGMMQKDTVVYIHNIYIFIYTCIVSVRNCPSKSMGCFQEGPESGGGFTTTGWPGANDAKTMRSEKQVQNNMGMGQN